MLRIKDILIILLLILSTTGCQTATELRKDVESDSIDKLTVGIVQREIKIGMSGSDVASVLGSPNIVSTDLERREVWIYDKVSRTSVSSSSKSGATLILIGGSTSASSASTSQKSLTIIIKFDKDGLVRDFSYRQSSF
jgi:outer membrane protein assembly factor BamE (lipoprotein component of BamABCDE complex)